MKIFIVDLIIFFLLPRLKRSNLLYVNNCKSGSKGMFPGEIDLFASMVLFFLGFGRFS
jgi:hypothetical protein